MVESGPKTLSYLYDLVPPPNCSKIVVLLYCHPTVCPLESSLVLSGRRRVITRTPAPAGIKVQSPRSLSLRKSSHSFTTIKYLSPASLDTHFSDSSENDLFRFLDFRISNYIP